MTKPEQSKPAGLAPPHLYRAPRCFLAMATTRWERDGEDFVSDRARIEGPTAGSTASSGARGREQSSAASARASAMLRLVVLRLTRPMAARLCSVHAKAVLRERVERPRRYDEARGETKETSVRASQKSVPTLVPDHHGDFFSPVRFVPRGWCTLGWWYARAARARDGRLRPAGLLPRPGGAGGHCRRGDARVPGPDARGGGGNRRDATDWTGAVHGHVHLPRRAARALRNYRERPLRGRAHRQVAPARQHPGAPHRVPARPRCGTVRPARGRADEAAADLRPLAPHARGHVSDRPESHLPGAPGGHPVRVGDLRRGARANAARAPGLHVRSSLPSRRTNGSRRLHRAGHAAVAAPGVVAPTTEDRERGEK